MTDSNQGYQSGSGMGNQASSQSGSRMGNQMSNQVGTQGSQAGNQLQDQTLAYDMLNSSKQGITTLAKVATESTNREIRDFIEQTVDSCVQEHFQLSDLIIAKGWYKPTNIADQINIDIQYAQAVSNQSQGRMQ